MTDLTTTQQVPNPTGKGGFGDHPENRNPGGWKPEYTYSYQCRRFMNMTVEEFKNWINITPEKERTMIEEQAYNAVLKARTKLDYLKEQNDRTEGKAPQTVIVDGGFFSKEKLKVEVVDEQRNTTETE